MSRFAIIENNIVLNLAEAESIEIMGLVLPDAELVIEITEATGEPHISGEYRPDVEKFIPYKPYESWSWDEKNWSWKAPKPYPKSVSAGAVVRWDEESLSWTEFIPVIEGA